MLFKSQVYTQVSGSIGGITYGHNAGGLYSRSRTVPVDPNSPDQVEARTALADAINDWSNTLTQAQRDAWDVYAANVPLLSPLGDPRNVSGAAQFVRSNSARLRAGLAVVAEGPATMTEAAVVTGAVATVDTAGLNELSVAFDTAAAGSDVIVQVSRPVSAARKFFKGPFRFVGTAPAETSPFTAAAYPFPIAVGQRVFLRLRRTADDGRLGPATIITTLVV